MSRLEKFVNDHRDAFDDADPPEHVWQQVEASLGQKNKRSFVLTPLIKWSTAAAALLVAAVAIFFSTHRQKTEASLAKTNTPESTDLVALAPEEAPQMNQFAKLIAGKQEELKVLAKEQPQLYKKFAKDIIQLDSSYNTLKTQLSVTPNRELLIEAMIQNLELQLNVLNQQLNIIHQIKHSKKTGHEKNKSFT